MTTARSPESAASSSACAISSSRRTSTPRSGRLEEVSAEGDSIHFRATGGEHHVLTIRERPKPSLLGVHFAAADRAAVDQLCGKAKGYGVAVEGDPAPLSGAPAAATASASTRPTACR